jgi:hypothetical protein
MTIHCLDALQRPITVSAWETWLSGRERKSLHVPEGLLILQTDLVDQLRVDNNALM